jgi:hypothetical protein
MKALILIVAVLISSVAANAQQRTEPSPPDKEKKEYSFLWGLFKSKDYPKGESVVFEIEKPEFSASFNELAVDSTKYKMESILWGAIQWSREKSTSEKAPNDGN